MRVSAPSSSWWLMPMTRAQFQAACDQIPLRYQKNEVAAQFSPPKKKQQRVTASLGTWTRTA